MFQHVAPYPGDPILTLNEDFQKDPRSSKVNLSIGVYLDQDGRLPEMRAVREARKALFADAAFGVTPYLPMEGAAGYRKEARTLAFGAEHGALLAERIASVQTLGGSGALKVGADFMAAWFRPARVWISDPTWDNHRAIFEGAGFPVQTYPYYSRATGAVDFDAMKTSLRTAARGDLVVLHACCHNPTGADLTREQWRELAELCRDRGLVPFFDVAYQGFGDGIEEDAFAVRHFASLGLSALVATSFSKNFALYGERCGSLHVLCPDGDQAARVLGQLKSAVRRNYSSPPAFGGRIVSTVLGSAELRTEWVGELDGMRKRVQHMRHALHERLKALRPGHDFDYLQSQRGMFSFTGLSPAQVVRLREEFGVYLVGSGRICLAALTEKTIEPTATAIAQVLE